MKKIGIDWDSQTVKHNSQVIDLKRVKDAISNLAPKLIDHYKFSPKFNSKTGEITYKYAWDSIFFDFHKSFGLKNLLDIIVRDKKNGQGTK